MIKPTKSIRKKLFLTLIGYSFFVALLFSLLGAMYVYTVEDAFFENILTQEQKTIYDSFKKTQEPSQPTYEFIQLLSYENLPDEVRSLLTQEPQRIEFYAKDNKHFHLRRLELDQTYYLLADVTELLVVRSLKSNMLKVLSIVIVVCLLISLLIAHFITKKTIHPLKTLTQKIIDSDKKQTINIQTQSYEEDEVGFLAHAIQKSWDRSQEFLEREKSFTRDVSHELRTPLAIVRTSNDLIKLQSNNNEHCENIDRSVQQIEQIIGSLLSLAREKSQQHNSNPVRILPLIEQSIIDHAYILDSKNAEVSVNVPHEAVIFQEKIVVVLLLNNLISNAFQYTQKGNINITFADQELVIENPLETLNLNLNENLPDSLNKSKTYTGFGIGLSIVRRLCEKYKIKYSLTSNKTLHSVKLKFQSE